MSCYTFEVESLLSILGEEQLKNILDTSEDVSLLNLAINIKVKSGSKHNFSIKKLITWAELDCKDVSDLLEKALTTQEDSKQYIFLLEHVAVRLINRLYVDVNVKFLDILLKLCDSTVKQKMINNCIRYEQIITLCDFLLTNKVTIAEARLFLTFVKFTDYTSLVYNCVSSGMNSNNLLFLCLCSEYFLSLDNPYCLINNTRFWSIIQENIFHPKTLEHKFSLYLFYKSIESLEKSKKETVTDDLVLKWNPTNASNWKNYLILLEICQEKQLHLIEPSLVLLESVHNLHLSWISGLYSVLLNHTQLRVVFYSAISLLKYISKVNDHITLKTLVPKIMKAFNHNEISEEAMLALKQLKELMHNLCVSKINLLFEELLCLNWVPSVFFVVLETFTVNDKPLITSLIYKMTNHVNKMPDITIRNACNLLLCEHIGNNICFHEFNPITKILNNLDRETLAQGWRLASFDAKLLLDLENLNIIDKSYLLSFYQILDAENIISQNLKIEMNNILYTIFNPTDTSELSQLVFLNMHEKLMNEQQIKLIVMYLINILHSAHEITNTEHFINVISQLEKFSNAFDFEELLNEAQFVLSKGTSQLPLSLIICTLLEKEDMAVLEQFALNFLYSHNKQSSQLCNIYLTLFYHIYCYSNPSLLTPQHFEKFSSITKHFADTVQLDLLLVIIKIFKVFIYLPVNYTQISNLLDYLWSIITNSNKTSCYKTVFEQFTDLVICYYSVDLSESPSSLEFVDAIYEYSKTYEKGQQILQKTLFSNIEKFSYHSKYKMLSIIVNMLLEYGLVIKKSERLVYTVFKSINKRFNVNNYLFNKTELIYGILKICNADIANYLTDCLLDKYQKSISKRYFPNSVLHFQKLRILQVLILIEPFITKEKRFSLATTLVDNLSLENHQPCVKQLVQILLIKLSSCSKVFNLIYEKFNQESASNLALMTTYTPIICNIVRFRGEEIIMEILQLFLRMAMGSQFKIRLYAQVAFINLYEFSQIVPDRYSNILTTYAKTFVAINKTLLEYDHQVEITMNKSRLLFNTLDANEDIPFEIILYFIPKLHYVSYTEWCDDLEVFKNLPKTEFKTRSIFIKNKSLYDNLTKDTFNIKPVKLCDEHTQYSTNLQKKILPWKFNEEKLKNESGLIIVTSLINNSANLGGLTRTCEIFKVSKVIVADKQIVDDKEFKSLSMSSEGWVDICEVKLHDLSDFLMEMKNSNYTVVGVEQTLNSVSLETYHFHQKTLLVLGNEKQGIHPKLFSIIDQCVEIPQLGLTRSLNVHVAGALFIWEYAKQHSLNKQSK